MLVEIERDNVDATAVGLATDIAIYRETNPGASPEEFKAYAVEAARGAIFALCNIDRFAAMPLLRCARKACTRSLAEENWIYEIDNNRPNPPRWYCDACGSIIIRYNRDFDDLKLDYKLIHRLTNKE